MRRSLVSKCRRSSAWKGNNSNIDNNNDIDYEMMHLLTTRTAVATTNPAAVIVVFLLILVPLHRSGEPVWNYRRSLAGTDDDRRIQT